MKRPGHKPGRFAFWDRSRAVVLLVAVMLAGPVLWDRLASGPRTAVRYFAPDSFYYHTVAWNIAEKSAVSFDGTRPTNGFHPGWQLTLGALAAAHRTLGGGRLGYLDLTLAVNVALLAAAVVLLGAALRRALGAVPEWFLLLPVGAYALLVLPYWCWCVDVRHLAIPSQGPFPLFGTWWSYANGMESGLTLLAFAALAWAFVRHGPARPWSVTAAAAALSLSRLDHALLAAPFVAAASWQEFRASRRTVRLLGPAAAFAAILGLYLSVNVAYAGAALPVSGVAKSSFPRPTRSNLDNLLTVLAGPPADDLALSRFYRAAQLLVPIVAAGTLLARRVWRRREAHDAWDDFLTLSAAGVLALGLYDALFVPPFAMGHWYLPVSTTFVSLAILPRAPWTLPPRARALAVVVVCAGVCVAFALWHRRPGYHDVYARFVFEQAPRLRARFQGREPRVLEDDDGVIAFATAFPCLSGTGLALDAEAARAAGRGELLELALQRGFDRVASLVYLGPAGYVSPSQRAAAAVQEAGRGHRQLVVESEEVAADGFFVMLRVRRIPFPGL